MAQGRVAELISLVLVGSIAGRLLMGWLADRWPRKRVMLLIYLIVAGSIPLLWAAPSPVTLRRRRRRLRRRPRRRLHDHPAHGRRPLRPEAHGARHGHRPHRRRRGGGGGAHGRGHPARPDRQLRPRLRPARGPGRPGRGGRSSAASPFTSRPGTDRIRPWQDTLDPPSTSVSARPARRKSRWPRRSAAPSARKRESRRARPRRRRIPISPASSPARSPFPGAKTSRPARVTTPRGARDDLGRAPSVGARPKLLGMTKGAATRPPPELSPGPGADAPGRRPGSPRR